MIVQFKKLHPKAQAPVKQHDRDAGFDIHCLGKEYAKLDKLQVVVKTGLAVDIPEGYVGLLFPRSSISRTDMSLSNSVGVIDSGYHGEILGKFNYHGPDHYDEGDRCLQLIIMPIPSINFQEVEEFESDSERGIKGHGSTGK